MSTIGTSGARRITDLECTIPPAGGWTCTGHCDSGPPLATGPTSLVIGDLTLVGAVLPGRGGTDSPDHPAFVMQGGAGWRTLLAAKSYKSPNNVRLSTVLGDLSALTGETVDQPADAVLGPVYGWDASTPVRPLRARAILAELVARGAIPTWRVAPNGHTRFDPWPAGGAADAHGTIEDRQLARGVRYVALSGSVAAWLPGGTVQGVTIGRTTFREHGGELKLEVWDA
jgi:hypothetical protein